MSGLVRSVARVIFPAAIAIALATLVRGYHQAGDGFSAGLLASVAAVIQYLCLGRSDARRAVGAHACRLVALVGLAIMLATVLVPLLGGRPPLWHVPRPGEPVLHAGEVALHTALLFDLGIALLVYGAAVTVFDELLAPEPPP